MRNYSFDILKLYLALLVIFIHIHVPYRNTILPLAQCAVPCFFMISGYFIFNVNTTVMTRKLKKYISRILIITLCSNLLYIIPYYYHHVKLPNTLFINGTDIINFIILGIPIFRPEGIHLWYLQAYLYTLVLLFFLVKKLGNKYLKIIQILVPILFTLHIVYKHCLPMIVKTEDELLFALLGYFPAYLSISFPSVCLGLIYKASCISNPCKQNNLHTILIFILSISCCYIESFILKYLNIQEHGDILIFTPLAAFTILKITHLFTIKHANILSKWGKQYSLYIYILHPFIGFIISFIRSYMPPFISGFYHYFSPIIIFFICIIIAMIFLRIKVKLECIISKK